MSMHNLLELDQLPNPDKPKPRPRIQQKRKESYGELDSPDRFQQPRPKPRRKGQKQREVDDVVSMSSVSSGGDHISRSAFDNPLFQDDDGVENRRKKKKTSPFSNKSPPTRHRSHHSSSDESDRENTDRNKTKGLKPERIRHKTQILHKSTLEADSDEDESYLYVEEDEAPKASKRKTRIDKSHLFASSPQQKTKKKRPTKESESETESEISDKKEKISKKKGHVSINIGEESKDENIKQSSEEPPTENTKKTFTRPKIGNIWQRFMTKGSSQPQSIDKPDKKSTDAEKGESEIKEKKEKETRINIESSSDESEESNKVRQKDQKIKSPELPALTTPIKVPASLKMQRKFQQLRQTGKKKLQSFKSEEEEPKIIEIKRRSSKHFMEPEDDSKTENSQSSEEPTTDNDEPEEPVKRKLSKLSTETLLKKTTSATSTRKTLKSLKNGDEKKDLLFGITIHGSDLLPLDPNILHPVVKVTLMTQDGKLIAKGNKSASKESIKSKGQKRQRSRKENGSKETIIPIMTQPYKFKFNLSPFVPTWNELLLFEEPFHEFLADNPDLIIFFEILDFLPMEKVNNSQEIDAGWYKLCWGFLKPVGANGVLNVERKLRLQLFKPVKLRRREMLDSLPLIFSWWKCERREKLLNTTLYVTVKGVNPPYTSNASLKQLLSMRKEDLTEAILESQLQNSDRKQSKQRKQRKIEESIDIRKAVNWSRLEGQSCKPPNKLLQALPSQSNMDSLTISGNVYCVKFSNCGLKLAAGLNTDDLHAVLIFDVPSGHLLRSLRNHHGLIYDISWKEVELDDHNNYFQYVCSASADATACIWRMKNNNINTIKHVKTLHHPSFVYCIQFHPSHPSLVVTGCFDFIIRVWDIDARSGGKSSKLIHETSPLFILDHHCNFVNCLVFDAQGTNLFSGDGNSHVYKWHIKSVLKRKSWILEKEVKLSEAGRIPVNSLSLHPNGIRLLVHLRDNCLKILDSKSFTLLKTIRGLVNERLQIRSCFSPCGNLILSGSESPTICIWDADTYEISKLLSPKGHQNCFVTSVDYHPFDFYLVVGIASAINEPNPILLYAYDAPRLSSIAMVQAGVSKFKNNLLQKQRKVSFAPKRGDSSEKFLSIINKLDKALKEAQDPKRIRHRSESLQRSISVDVPPLTPEKRSRPNSAMGNFAEKRNSDSDSSERKKYKKKSPRTFIEDRLEELILPSKNSPDVDNENLEMDQPQLNIPDPIEIPDPVEIPISEKSEGHDQNSKVASMSDDRPNENPELLSPKNLPKPRRPRTISKIPLPILESPRHVAAAGDNSKGSNKFTMPPENSKSLTGADDTEPINLKDSQQIQGEIRHVEVHNQE